MRHILPYVAIVLLSASAAWGQEIAAPEPPVQPTPEYRMQSGDTVDVRFTYHPEMNEQSVQIRPDGKISMHLLGDVQFADRTTEEVSKYLETAYEASLKNPRITVQIRGFSTLKAYVSGEVSHPGTIPLATNMNVLAAISEVGGINLRGNQNRVFLIRKQPDGNPGRQEVVLFDPQGQPTLAALTPLQPYDVILVPESKIAKADRWIDQHIRQLIPLNLNAGFTYLWQNLSNAGSAVITPPF